MFIAENRESMDNATELEPNRSLVIPTFTLTPAEATTTRIQTLRQRLFSIPLQ